MARLPKGIWHTEDALMSGLAIGQLIVAESTAASVKAVLTGEGSDEILGGYSWYPTLRILDPVFRLPVPFRRWLGSVPAIRRRWPGAAGLIRGPREMNFERYSRSITHLRSQDYGDAIFSPRIIADLGRHGAPDDALQPPDGFDTWHPFAQMQYFDIKHRMGDAVVLGLDRASMAYSVEARVPFLDHEVVEFCARIPPQVKMKWLREKHILRRAMDGILPPDIVRRKKWPMRVPLDEWLRGKLPAFAADLLSETALRDTGYFDPVRVTALLQRHRERRENLAPAVSGVLGVQIWLRLFKGGHLERGEAPCVTL
jgi:asparagine synthase (glutamine-hydrolysing)